MRTVAAPQATATLRSICERPPLSSNPGSHPDSASLDHSLSSSTDMQLALLLPGSPGSFVQSQIFREQVWMIVYIYVVRRTETATLLHIAAVVLHCTCLMSQLDCALSRIIIIVSWFPSLQGCVCHAGNWGSGWELYSISAGALLCSTGLRRPTIYTQTGIYPFCKLTYGTACDAHTYVLLMQFDLGYSWLHIQAECVTT